MRSCKGLKPTSHHSLGDGISWSGFQSLTVLTQTDRQTHSYSHSMGSLQFPIHLAPRLWFMGGNRSTSRIHTLIWGEHTYSHSRPKCWIVCVCVCVLQVYSNRQVRSGLFELYCLIKHCNDTSCIFPFAV